MTLKAVAQQSSLFESQHQQLWKSDIVFRELFRLPLNVGANAV